MVHEGVAADAPRRGVVQEEGVREAGVSAAQAVAASRGCHVLPGRRGSEEGGSGAPDGAEVGPDRACGGKYGLLESGGIS